MLAITSGLSAVLTLLAASGVVVHEGVVGLVFLVLILLIAETFGFWKGLLAAVGCNLVLVYFFLEPRYVFWADDPQELLSLPLFLLASVIGGSLLQTSRELTRQAEAGQAQSNALLSLHRSIMGQTDPHASIAALCQEVVRALGANGAAVLTRQAGNWTVVGSAGYGPGMQPPDDAEAALADLALSEGVSTHLQTPGGGAMQAVFVPLTAADRNLGVLRIESSAGSSTLDEESEALMMAFAREGALAISRLEFETVARQADALRQADEMKTALLNAISHDLKTPLASIKTSTSSLLDANVTWDNATRNGFLEIIASENERLNKTIDELLALSRIESGAVQPLFDQVKLGHIVEDAIELKAPLLNGRKVHVDLSDVSVRTDASLMRQAVANLLENAALHSRAGGGIRIQGQAMAGAVHLTIEDEGPGVDADELPYIFNAFYRARNGLALPNGTGLGLAIVKGFVTLCGGSIRAQSSPATTRFVIELPLGQTGAG